MSNLQRLLDLYREDERTQSIIRVIDQEAPARVLLENTVGAMDGFVLLGTYQERSQYNHFFIASDKEEAAYFQNTLDQLQDCLLYTSPSPRDATLSRMPSSA